MGSLTNEEKESLARIIQAMYGQISFLSQKQRFNEKTVDAVEKALKSTANCNANMKDLITSLIGGSSLLATGWLKRALRSVERKIDSDRIKFDSFLCRVTGARNWRSEIEMTVYF